MPTDIHTPIYEASTALAGFLHLLENMADRPLSGITPFELTVLLLPVQERLETALAALHKPAVI